MPDFSFSSPLPSKEGSPRLSGDSQGILSLPDLASPPASPESEHGPVDPPIGLPHRDSLPHSDDSLIIPGHPVADRIERTLEERGAESQPASPDSPLVLSHSPGILLPAPPKILVPENTIPSGKILIPSSSECKSFSARGESSVPTSDLLMAFAAPVRFFETVAARVGWTPDRDIWDALHRIFLTQGTSGGDTSQLFSTIVSLVSSDPDTLGANPFQGGESSPFSRFVHATLETLACGKPSLSEWNRQLQALTLVTDAFRFAHDCFSAPESDAVESVLATISSFSLSRFHTGERLYGAWDFLSRFAITSPSHCEAILHLMDHYGALKHPLSLGLLAHAPEHGQFRKNQRERIDQLISLCAGFPEEVLARFSDIMDLQSGIITFFPDGKPDGQVGMELELYQNILGAPLPEGFSLGNDGGGNPELRREPDSRFLAYSTDWQEHLFSLGRWIDTSLSSLISLHVHVDRSDDPTIRSRQRLFLSALFGTQPKDMFENGIISTFETRTALEAYTSQYSPRNGVPKTTVFHPMIDFLLVLSDPQTSYSLDHITSSWQHFSHPIDDRFSALVHVTDSPAARAAGALFLVSPLGRRLVGSKRAEASLRLSSVSSSSRPTYASLLLLPKDTIFENLLAMFPASRNPSTSTYPSGFLRQFPDIVAARREDLSFDERCTLVERFLSLADPLSEAYLHQIPPQVFSTIPFLDLPVGKTQKLLDLCLRATKWKQSSIGWEQMSAALSNLSFSTPEKTKILIDAFRAYLSDVPWNPIPNIFSCVFQTLRDLGNDATTTRSILHMLLREHQTSPSVSSALLGAYAQELGAFHPNPDTVITRDFPLFFPSNPNGGILRDTLPLFLSTLQTIPFEHHHVEKLLLFTKSCLEHTKRSGALDADMIPPVLTFLSSCPVFSDTDREDMLRFIVSTVLSRSADSRVPRDIAWKLLTTLPHFPLERQKKRELADYLLSPFLRFHVFDSGSPSWKEFTSHLGNLAGDLFDPEFLFSNLSACLDRMESSVFFRHNGPSVFLSALDAFSSFPYIQETTEQISRLLEFFSSEMPHFFCRSEFATTLLEILPRLPFEPSRTLDLLIQMEKEMNGAHAEFVMGKFFYVVSLTASVEPSLSESARELFLRIFRKTEAFLSDSHDHSAVSSSQLTVMLECIHTLSFPKRDAIPLIEWNIAHLNFLRYPARWGWHFSQFLSSSDLENAEKMRLISLYLDRVLDGVEADNPSTHSSAESCLYATLPELLSLGLDEEDENRLVSRVLSVNLPSSRSFFLGSVFSILDNSRQRRGSWRARSSVPGRRRSPHGTDRP